MIEFIYLCISSLNCWKSHAEYTAVTVFVALLFNFLLFFWRLLCLPSCFPCFENKVDCTWKTGLIFFLFWFFLLLFLRANFVQSFSHISLMLKTISSIDKFTNNIARSISSHKSVLELLSNIGQLSLCFLNLLLRFGKLWKRLLFPILVKFILYFSFEVCQSGTLNLIDSFELFSNKMVFQWRQILLQIRRHFLAIIRARSTELISIEILRQRQSIHDKLLLKRWHLILLLLNFW